MGDANGCRLFEGIRHPKHVWADLTGPMRTDRVARVRAGFGRAALAVVIITPIYKAAYSGLLKTFLDARPPSALRGKVVLPIAVGGSAAHVLAIDYAFRPVLNSLDSLHVVEGLFLLDKQVTVLESGAAAPGAGASPTAGRRPGTLFARSRRARSAQTLTP